MEFDMQHEQWLFGGEQYTAPVLKEIDEFMETASGGPCCDCGYKKKTYTKNDFMLSVRKESR